MGNVGSILEEKGTTIHGVSPSATAHDAVERMCRVSVGALLVFDLDTLVGIVSERDIMRRVVLERRDPAQTQVSDIMSTDLAYVSVDTLVAEAMELMTARRCRHLPVLDGSRLAGVVSIGDLVHAVTRSQEFEIRTLTEYVSGSPAPAG